MRSAVRIIDKVSQQSDVALSDLINNNFFIYDSSVQKWRNKTSSEVVSFLLPSQVGNSGKFLKTNGTSLSWDAVSGSGTVASVSVATANGVSGTVANSTVNPIITLSLGDITPSTVNGLTLASQATGFTVAGGTSSRTLTVSGNANVSGTNTGDQTITLSGDISGSGTGSITTAIANTSVTYGKIQNVSTNNRLLGRSTSGAGTIEEITVGSGLSLSGGTLTSTINSSNSVVVTVNFENLSSDESYSASATLTGQSWVTSSSKIVCSVFGVATADHDPDDYILEGVYAFATNIVNGVGFDVIALAPNGTFGRYIIHCIGV